MTIAALALLGASYTATLAVGIAIGVLIRRAQARRLREATTWLAMSAQTAWAAANDLAARNERYAAVFARRRARIADRQHRPDRLAPHTAW